MDSALKNIAPGWRKLLESEFEKTYFQNLIRFLKEEEKQGHEIYPAQENIFRALKNPDFNEVKVVILGQDPYHGPGQAVGMSFAVPNDLKKKPPSLKNIFKEIESDLKVRVNPGFSALTEWAKGGVLMLNTVLTVRQQQAFSHRAQGWEIFTDKIISLLGEREKPVVFILWGGPARKKAALIKRSHHTIIESAHPSPLSAYQGFFGSRCFSKTNSVLERMGEKPISWEITS